LSDNHYEVLGVEATASRDELRDAYRARVDALTAARDKKGITPGQLDENRNEVARVRSAWNVLSDPFQRQRYDASVETGAATAADGVEIVDEAAEPEVQLTGWRKLMAPPPPKPKAVNGSNGSKGSATPARPGKQPTVKLPEGMRIAQPKARGMSLLFDLSIVLVLFYAVNVLLPPVIQSDYSTIRDQVTSVDDAKTAQGKIDDAQKSIKDASQAVSKAESAGKQQDLKSAQSDLKSAQSDLKSAQQDFAKAQSDFNKKQDDRNLPHENLPHSSDKLQSKADDLAGQIRGTTFISAGITLVVALAYLVPITARTGRTFGMRRRGVKVVRVDGSPVGWWPSFARFLIPLLLGIVGFVTVLGILGPVVALGVVLWGYRDANGQGLHDKLARTLVVEA